MRKALNLKSWSMTIYCFIICRHVHVYVWSQIHAMIKRNKGKIDQTLFLVPQANVKNWSTCYLHKTSFGWNQVFININHYNKHFNQTIDIFASVYYHCTFEVVWDSDVPVSKNQCFFFRKELRYSKICWIPSTYIC